MTEKPQADLFGDDDLPPLEPADVLQITTPVIDIQDLEHKPGPETRVSNKGVRVEPKLDSDDERDLVREEEEALRAMEQIEKELKGQMPG